MEKKRSTITFTLWLLLALSCQTSLAMPGESMTMMNNETLAQELLNRLMDMVLSANATHGIDGLPDKFTKLPRSQLTSCITDKQRTLVAFCKANVTEWMKTDSREASHETSQEKMDQGYGGRLPLILANCIMKQSGSVDMATDQINATNLKMNFIGESSLTAAQKAAAAVTLDSCLATNFTMSPPPNGRRPPPPPPANGPEGKKNCSKNSVKAFYCGTRAIILNGCADAPRTAAITTSITMDDNIGATPSEVNIKRDERAAVPHTNAGGNSKNIPVNGMKSLLLQQLPENDY